MVIEISKKITKNVYDEMKKDLITNKFGTSTIYMKYSKQHNLDKIQFNQIIKRIKDEENISKKTMKKAKRMQNPFSYQDKHPNNYKINQYDILE